MFAINAADPAPIWKQIEEGMRRLIALGSLKAGAPALKAAVEKAEKSISGESRRLHYLSVPPNAALSAVRMLGEAGLVEGSRIIMEKPFGTDLKSAVALNAKLHEVFSEEQIFRIDHFLGKEMVQNIMAFRFANGLQFEVKRPGPVVDLAAVHMDFRYRDWFPREPNVGHETLIYECRSMARLFGLGD